jgi:hypothetical protein
VSPDRDKISIWTTNGADDIVVQRTSGVDYWECESRGLGTPSSRSPSSR